MVEDDFACTITTHLPLEQPFAQTSIMAVFCVPPTLVFRWGDGVAVTFTGTPAST